jgi:hypothetical protein
VTQRAPGPGNLSSACRWAKAHSIAVAGAGSAASAWLISYLVGNRFSGMLAGPDDVSIWASLGYYFSRNLRFNPLPHLVLATDQAFFPYGVNGVFQPWAPERDAFFALLFLLKGPGPWLQIYYLIGTFITLFGSYVLLQRDFGCRRAATIALLVGTMNFYALQQYPNHLNISVIHWAVLSFLTDFVIVRRVVLRYPVSLRLLLGRAALASLSFGLDLGYVAGLPLMSLFVSGVFLFVLVTWRWTRAPARRVNGFGHAYLSSKAELARHPISIGGIFVIWVVASVVYIPLALQIAGVARSPAFAAMPSGVHGQMPWRLLLPYFPSVPPGTGRVGWALLILGIGGLYCERRRWPMYVPAVTILAMCLAYHPIFSPTLKLFPWFAFARIADRITVAYPILFALFAISADLAVLPVRLRKWFLGTMVVVAIVEARTALSGGHGRVLYEYSDAFRAYMQTIRRQPGEALLDWPFCVTGGNGVGTNDGLCPYYVQNHLDLAYAPYHQKKLVGEYFGRLHPSQLRPFMRAHWDAMFAPDDDDVFRARRQTRCFDDEEWAFFSEFFALNDFAGLQLHTSLLPPGCAADFYTRFGPPLAEVSLPDGNALAFVAKPTALRADVDRDAGLRATLQRAFDPGRGAVDVLAKPVPLEVDTTGLSGFEQDSRERWRWGLGAEVTLEFSMRASHAVKLRFTFFNPAWKEQHVRLLVNGVTLGVYTGDPRDGRTTDTVSFDGQASANRVEFRCDLWNGQDGRWFAARDPRPLNIQFTQWTIE